MNNNPMNGFGMNTNNTYGMNGGVYPQPDMNAAGFGNPTMTTGNPTLDLLNQSNGVIPNAGAPAPTGNPTLDLLNQSQAQDNSYGFVPPMDSNPSPDMNYQQQPSSTFGIDSNMGMMPDYGNTMPQGGVQMPMDMQQVPQQGYGMDPQYGGMMQQPMPQPVDYNMQMIQQPLTSMEMAPVPEPTPVVEPPTNPYGFVPMMPEPVPAQQEQPAAPSTGEFNFSFIPLREENVQPEAQPTPVEQPVMPQPQMNMNYGEQAVMPTPTFIQPQGMMPEPAPQMAPVEVAPQPVYPDPIQQMPMDYTQQIPQQSMMQVPGQMPMDMQQPVPQQGYGMDPQYGGMMQQPMMQPQGVMPGQMPMDYNAQMGAPMGYPQPMMQPAQDPNMLYPGIPDDVGNFPQ